MSKEFQQSIDNLKSSIANLNNVNSLLVKNKGNQEEFLNYLNSNLSQVNDRLKTLAANIANIKKTIDSLQQQVNNNDSDINGKSQQLQQLQQQLLQYQNKQKMLEDALKRIQENSAAEKNRLQSDIDDKENALRILTKEKDQLEGEKAALQAQLDAQGKPSSEAMEALQKQIGDLVQQSADKQAEIDKLTSIIESKDAEIERLNKEKGTDVNLQNQINACNEQVASLTNDITNLNATINQLQMEKDQLIAIINEATNTINGAMEKLNELSQQFPDEANMGKLKSIFSEINGVIDNINGSMNSLPSVTGSANNQSPPAGVNLDQGSKSSSKYPVNNGNRLSLEEIKEALIAKNNQVIKDTNVTDNKYSQALQELNKPNLSTETMQKILRRLKFNNDNMVMGGRKMAKRTNKMMKRMNKMNKMKTKKQKGGYSYNKSLQKNKMSAGGKAKFNSSVTLKKRKKNRRATRKIA